MDERWREELRDMVRDASALAMLGGDAGRAREVGDVCARYPAGVTPYYAGLIDVDDPTDPLKPMVIPDPRELTPRDWLPTDPLGEERHSPVEGLVQRYGDRAVVLVTTRCAGYCRFCTRKRLAGRRYGRISDEALEGVVTYLGAHPEVWDVLVSGGDPLVMDDDVLARILGAITSVPSVRHVRLATRSLSYLPMRITEGLVGVLRRHAPLAVMTHFDHARELTDEARAAIQRIASGGIPLFNQTVLLRGVNDELGALVELCRELLVAGVKPYYLFLPDLTEGTDHLRVGGARALELVALLRSSLSGLAVPTLAVDLDGPGSKLVLSPTSMEVAEGGVWLTDGRDGPRHWYPDPRTDEGAR